MKHEISNPLDQYQILKLIPESNEEEKWLYKLQKDLHSLYGPQVKLLVSSSTIDTREDTCSRLEFDLIEDPLRS